MNIGLFTDTYFPQINGVATSVHTLASALEERGHQVYIFTPSDPKADSEESAHIIRMPSMPFLLLKNYRVGTMYSPFALAKISHLHLDIVHTQTEFPLGNFGRFLAKTHNIPMVHTYHTMYEDYVHYLGHGVLVTPGVAREFSKLFCNAANDVVAPTEKAKQSLLDYGVKKPICIIPTGIDTKRFAKNNFDPKEILSLKESFGFQENTPVLLSLGRVAKEKSIDVLLRAMPKLLEKCPEVMFLIIGDGPEKENLMALSASLGIADHVVFAGAKPWHEIGKYYQLGTVFASASLSETQGLTFAEAMAGGIPVVAKKDDCIQALIEHEQTGLLFETDDALADLLATLFQDTELQKTLSKNAMKKMDALSVETFAEKMEHLYQIAVFAHEYEPKLPLAVKPVAASVRAVRRLGGIPQRVVRKQLQHATTLVGHLPAFRNFRTIKEEVKDDVFKKEVLLEAMENKEENPSEPIKRDLL